MTNFDLPAMFYEWDPRMLTTCMSGKWVMGSRPAPENMIGISYAQGRAHGGVNSISLSFLSG